MACGSWPWLWKTLPWSTCYHESVRVLTNAWPSRSVTLPEYGAHMQYTHTVHDHHMHINYDQDYDTRWLRVGGRIIIFTLLQIQLLYRSLSYEHQNQSNDTKCRPLHMTHATVHDAWQYGTSILNIMNMNITTTLLVFCSCPQCMHFTMDRLACSRTSTFCHLIISLLGATVQHASANRSKLFQWVLASSADPKTYKNQRHVFVCRIHASVCKKLPDARIWSIRLVFWRIISLIF